MDGVDVVDEVDVFCFVHFVYALFALILGAIYFFANRTDLFKLDDDPAGKSVPEFLSC